MRNKLKMNGLVVSTTLVAVLAFGCTTNVPPDGQQVSASEIMTSVDPAGLTPGNPPLIVSGPAGMTSASVDAAATMAARQTSGGVFVGVASPSKAPADAVTIAEPRLAPPAIPLATANRSITSPGAAALEDASLGLRTLNTEAAAASPNVSMSARRSATLPAGGLGATSAEVVYGTSGVDVSAVVPATASAAQVVYGTSADVGGTSVTVMSPVVTAPTSFGRGGTRAYRNGLRVTTTGRGTKLLTNVP